MAGRRFSWGFALVFVSALWCGVSAGQDARGGARTIPGALVTTRTKQAYRFHFSGLQGDDAVRLAGQLWPVVAKLPPENPLHRTFQDAKDREGFLDEYRSLRNILLEAGIDTVYFLADEYWIESRTLPGTVVVAGDAAVRDRLRRRLSAAGHDDWAAAVAKFEPDSKAPGWLTYRVAAAAAGQDAAPKKRQFVEHALLESCPVSPATIRLDSLPAVRVDLNWATPLTVVNLERNSLDTVLSQILSALVPASSRILELSKDVDATTVSASGYPVTHVRQVAHLRTRDEAISLAAEVERQINDTVRKIVDSDSDLGWLVGLLGKSMVVVSVEGSDVHMIMKPPALFDLSMAHQKSLESLDLDWTALPPPAGRHWELVGAVGNASRADVFARVHAIRVRGGGDLYQSLDPNSSLARFDVPLGDAGLVVYRNLKGQLKVDLSKPGNKATELPALELLDDRQRLMAVLRLDLGPGDPRYDLTRTRGVLAKRMTERKGAEQAAEKKVDEVENAYQRERLDGGAFMAPDVFELWQSKLSSAHRDLSRERAARLILEELDSQARQTQRSFPAATLVNNQTSLAAARGDWSMDRQRFPFAGRWLFDSGILTLHQDSNGTVAGVFATKVFHNTATHDIDGTKPTSGTAILVGQAKESTLRFTMFDHLNRERAGKLVLDANALGGTWTLAATDPLLAPDGKDGTPPEKVKKGGSKPKQPASKGARTTAPTLPGNSPFRVPAAGNPFGLPPLPRKPAKNAEGPRQGNLDRIDVAPPDPSWIQPANTGRLAGYWVHAEDKRMNILFKASSDDLLVGTQGTLPAPKGNLRAAVAGQHVLLLENVHSELIAPSVREAVLADAGDSLQFLGLRDPTAASGLFGRGSTPLILKRDRNP